jgi:hypothetical protein
MPGYPITGIFGIVSLAGVTALMVLDPQNRIVLAAALVYIAVMICDPTLIHSSAQHQLAPEDRRPCPDNTDRSRVNGYLEGTLGTSNRWRPQEKLQNSRVLLTDSRHPPVASS